MPSSARDPHRPFGELAQVEHEVSRRERVAGRGRRAGLVALAALRAGVEVEQVARREIGDPLVADLVRLRVLGQRHEAPTGLRVLDGDAGRARQHVDGLRERDGRDERERHDPVQPPVDSVRRLCGVPVEADVDEALADDPPDRRPGLERRIGLGDPERLEQEAGQREEEQQAEEEPVAADVSRAIVLVRLPVGSPVAQPERLDDAALHGQHDQADDQRAAEDVEEERVRLVEPALEELEAGGPGCRPGT